MAADPEVVRLLGEIRDEVRLLRETLGRRPRRAPDEAHVALARAVAAATAGRVFSARELLQHSTLDGQEDLRAAIVGVCGPGAGARSLGKALRRCENADLDGVVITRAGTDGNDPPSAE
jgi:hypothetical protein